MKSLTPTMCCCSRLDCCSFEDANVLPGVTIVGNRIEPGQEAFANLLLGLFHWKLDTTDTRAYSLAPADYPRLSLFSFKSSNSYLNQVFWLVYDGATSWRSILHFCIRPFTPCIGWMGPIVFFTSAYTIMS
jgi:hypothetical protein